MEEDGQNGGGAWMGQEQQKKMMDEEEEDERQPPQLRHSKTVRKSKLIKMGTIMNFFLYSA
jgi:hypothetical protein